MARDTSPNQNTTTWSSVSIVYPDTNAPNPNPATWAVEPIVVDSMNVYMVANTASDEYLAVEYYFENTNTGANSGWQSTPIWSQQYQHYDTPLHYRVKSRDTSPDQNETAWSAVKSVTIPTPSTPGLLIDASFQVPTYNNRHTSPVFPRWNVASASSVGMTVHPKRIGDRRAEGVAELMVAVRDGYAARLSRNVLFAWHRMLMMGAPRIKAGEGGAGRIRGWHDGKEVCGNHENDQAHGNP